MIPGGGATGAMIWKEARENLKWAVFAVLGTAGALFIELRDILGGRPLGVREESPLTDDNFLMFTTACAAAAGLVFGLAQTLPERRADQWAFLVHRPVSRTRLFLAKMLTALAMYFVAVGVPFACAIAWVAKPGNMLAPFDPAMALPAVADLLAGVVYYFAGIAIGMREARWYASRVLALALAVVCSAAVITLPWFWHALLAIVVSVALLATAAWGLFNTGGGYARLPVAAKVGLGAAVFTGIVLLGGIVVGAAGHLLIPQPTWSFVSTQYVVDSSGEVVRLTRGGGARATLTITDPHGNALPAYAGLDAIAIDARFTDLAGTTVGTDPRHRMWVNMIMTAYRRSDRYFLGLYGGQTERWYYSHRERYIVGYGQDNGDVIGYITPAGFHPGPAAPAERFEGELPMWAYSANSLLTLTSGVYKLDAPQRQLLPAFAPPPGEQVISAATAFAPLPRGTEAVDTSAPTRLVPVFDAVATSGGVTVLSSDGQPHFTLPLEHGPADGYVRVSIDWRKETGRYYVGYQPNWVDARSSTLPHHLTEVSPAGEALARHVLPPLPALTPPPARRAESLLIGAATPPAGLALFFVAVPWLQGELAGSPTADPKLADAFLATLLSGLACAALTLALARRYTLTRRATVGWTVGNFLLGPAGVLTMLAIREWPAQEQCPACRRRRVVEGDLCPHCKAAAEPPAPDGTEIFAV